MNTVVTENVNFINRLPPEILIRIFFLTQQQTTRSRYPRLCLKPSWVCQYWREIIIGHSGFWTVITLSPWRGKEFIQQLVQRSGSAQLSVWSPQPHDFYEPGEAKEIFSGFNKFLEITSHHIKFLLITDDENRDLAKLLVGKMLPVLDIFIFHGRLFNTSEGELGEIIKSAPKLQYLEVYPTLSRPSLFELQPCFSRLKGLIIPLTCSAVAIHFLSCLALCVNLESLVVRTQSINSLIIENTYPPRSLPNLISLYIDDYTIMDSIRAPALKLLTIMDPPDRQLPEPNFSFLDEYDLSSVTHLAILGYNTLTEAFSTIWIRGSAGPKPQRRIILSLLDDPDVDIRGGIRPSILSSEHTQFSFATCTHYGTVVNGSATDFESPFIPNLSSRLSPKLPNVEALLIDPYYMSGAKPYERHSLSDIKLSLGIFFKRIFDTFISEKLRWLVIKDTQGHLDLLQIMFNAINDCFSLTDLETVTFCINDDTYRIRYNIGGHAFGKELINFLRVRKAAGYPALQTFELESPKGMAFPEKWTTEAAALGTQIHHFPCKQKHNVDFDID